MLDGCVVAAGREAGAVTAAGGGGGGDKGDGDGDGDGDVAGGGDTIVGCIDSAGEVATASGICLGGGVGVALATIAGVARGVGVGVGFFGSGFGAAAVMAVRLRASSVARALGRVVAAAGACVGSGSVDGAGADRPGDGAGSSAGRSASIVNRSAWTAVCGSDNAALVFTTGGLTSQYRNATVPTTVVIDAAMAARGVRARPGGYSTATERRSGGAMDSVSVGAGIGGGICRGSSGSGRGATGGSGTSGRSISFAGSAPDSSGNRDSQSTPFAASYIFTRPS